MEKEVEKNTKYSRTEIAKLRKFIEMVKNETTRAELVCWGNHSAYNHGW